MAEQEGVIKYRLDFQPADAPCDSVAFRSLRAWRAVLHRLALVGQQPDRYLGYGYGNVSLRAQPGF
ncbi:MAG: class II aldolase/adducin family protein, partial [Abyssibacter sp.]